MKVNNIIINDVANFLTNDENKKIKIINEFNQLETSELKDLMKLNPYIGGIIYHKDHYIIPLGYKENLFLNKFNIDNSFPSICIEIYEEYALCTSYDGNKQLISITKDKILSILNSLENRLENYKVYYSYGSKAGEQAYKTGLTNIYEPLFLIIDYLSNNNYLNQNESLIDGVNHLEEKVKRRIK